VLALSPDGSHSVVLAGPSGGSLAGPTGGSPDLWLADLRTGGMNRLTQSGRAGPPTWLPDGVRIAYSRFSPEGGEDIVVRRLDGAGGERMLYHAANPLTVTDVTRDGGRVVFSDYGVTKGRIHLAPVDGTAPVELVAEGEGFEEGGKLSPDGRWIAYVSMKTSRMEVCVRRLDGRGGSWQLSTNGGAGVRWGRDGREIFFVTGERLVRVSIEVHGDDLIVGPAQALFEVPPSPTAIAFRDYDYDPRGDRFLFTRPPRALAEPREIAVSLGWAGRLKERVK
jgi:Tol biopolymer transport system component